MLSMPFVDDAAMGQAYLPLVVDVKPRQIK